MNRIYEVEEGRPIWKLRPVMLLVTLVAVVLVALVALALVVTGPAAQAVGDAIGLGSTAVLVWNIAKWPVMLVVVVLIVALLYYATPNVKQPKFRWISVGALVAIVVWVLASAAFGFYVANFSSYNKTYGSLAGVIVFLLWLWITNLALLFGAELDAELERGRELQAGVAAEETVQLPPRDTRNERQARGQAAAGRRARTPAAREPRRDPEGRGRTHEKDRIRGAEQHVRQDPLPPVGLVGSVVAGVSPGQVFKQVWKHAAPGDQHDAPRALESEYPLREVLVAAAVQGAIFAVVKALMTGAAPARSSAGRASGPVTSGRKFARWSRSHHH